MNVCVCVCVRGCARMRPSILLHAVCGGVCVSILLIGLLFQLLIFVFVSFHSPLCCVDECLLSS